jgi:hypothetical protein
MIIRKTFFVTTAVVIMFTSYTGYSSGNNAIVKPDLKKDLACGSSLHPQIWRPGGIKAGLWVGNANNFDHRYRTILRFDLRPFLIAGYIKKALLKFTVSGIYGKQAKRAFKVQSFTDEKIQLGFNDLTDSRVKLIKKFVLKRKMKYPATLTINVSSEINSALDKGYGSCTFRILDEWSEQHGNPENSNAGTSILPASVELDIIK